jgi:hypothetical protein
VSAGLPNGIDPKFRKKKLIFSDNQFHLPTAKINASDRSCTLNNSKESRETSNGYLKAQGRKFETIVRPVQK